MKKGITVVFILLMLISTCGMADQVKLFTHIEAQGNSYNPGEDFSIYVVPVNQDSKYLNNLQVNLSLPENITIMKTILPDNPSQLDPFEAKVFEYVVRNTAPLQITLPVTGENGIPVVAWALIGMVAVFILWKVGFKRGTSFFLVICFCVQLIPAHSIAEENLVIGQEGRLNITVDGQNIIVTASATATEGSDLAVTDMDQDGLSTLEEMFYGSDDKKTDTDGDGLTDYQEIHIFFTDPNKMDTDGDGIQDGHEDADEDGLDNLDELVRRTSPVQRDTDGDGLNDGDEVGRGTNPLNADTDGDGMMDGFEVRHGFDPLRYDQRVTVTNGYTGLSSINTQVTVNNVTGVQAQSLIVSEVPGDDILLGSHLEGWIGNACDVTMDDSSGGLDTTLTMSYDKSMIGPDFEPTIYYFDEENQLLVEEENQTDDKNNGRVIAHPTHFSKRVLLNKKGRITSEAIIEKNSLPTPSKKASVYILRDTDIRVSQKVTNIIEEIAAYAKELFGNQVESGHYVANQISMTLDKFTPYSANYKIIYQGSMITSWIDWFTPTAFVENWIQYTENNDEIYLITSTRDLMTKKQAQGIIKQLNGKKNKIHIISTVVDQKYKDSDLEGAAYLAQQTGGQFILVSTLDDVKGNHTYEIDSNNDGISDGDTWDIIKGNIKSDIFGNVFEKCTYKEIQSNDDYDKDGIKNGDEVMVKSKNGKKYVYVQSLPTLRDSDFDGIEDGQEAKMALNNNHYVKWNEEMLSNAVNANLSMDYRWFEMEPSIFNRRLATTSMLIAATAYDETTSTLDGKTRMKAFHDLLGLDGVESRRISGYGMHNAMATMGYHEFTDQNSNILVILVAVTGYYDNGWEWVSNFTVGDSTESPLWTRGNDKWFKALWTNDKENGKWHDLGNCLTDNQTRLWSDEKNHLGFDIAATLLSYAVADYIQNTCMAAVQKANKVCIWTTGHSRGGAVSNLFAEKIIDRKNQKINDLIPKNKCRVFAYDFATPRTTQHTDYNDNRYDGIINIINERDVVPMLPLQYPWKFNPFGREFVFDLEKVSDTECQSNQAYELFRVSNFTNVKNGTTINPLSDNVAGIVNEFKDKAYVSPHIAFFEMASMLPHKVLPTSYSILDKFQNAFASLSSSRAGLYSKKDVIQFNMKNFNTLIEIDKRAKILAFISNELAREKQYTRPGNKPGDAKQYFGYDLDLTKGKVWVTPQYTMTLFGRAVAEVFHSNILPLAEFYKKSVNGISDINALKGAIEMTIGSGLLATHIDAGYYLGSFFAKEVRGYANGGNNAQSPIYSEESKVDQWK